MTDDEAVPKRWSIDPEPTATEFVAIYSALQRPVDHETSHDIPQESRWASAARREQLRTALEDTGNGWNR